MTLPLPRIVRNIGTNWLLLALNVGISFFMSPFIVNKLGATYYGIWAVATQFTAYLYLLDFGVRESVIRYTSKYATRHQGKQLNRILNTAFLLYVPITLVCIGLTLLCAWGVPRWFDIPDSHVTEAQWAVLFVGLTVAQTFIFNVFTGVLQGLHRFDIANLTGIAITILRMILLIAALSMGYKLIALAAIQFFMAILGGTIGAAFALRLLRSHDIPLTLQRMRGRRFIALGRKVFGYGFYVLVNNVAQKINFASDAVVIGIFMPVASITPYAIAGSLIDYLRMLLMSTAQVFNPMSSALHTERKPKEVADLLARGSRLAVLITLPIALVYAVLGEHFIGLWMGEPYKVAAGEVLLVLGLTQILSAPHYVVSSVLYGMSKHRAMALLRVGEAVANLSLSIFLVQRMGILGVALGTAISHAVVVIGILPILVARLLRMSILRYLVSAYSKPLVAAMPFLAGALWLRQHYLAENLFQFFLQIGLLCTVYVGAVYIVALDGEQRAALRRMIGLGAPRT